MTLQGIYNQIDEQREILVQLLNAAKKNPIAPNRLSDVCVKLSILNGLLGSQLPDLKLAQLEVEKNVYAKIKQDGGPATEANAQARLQSLKERKAYETAEIRHKDLWKLISMAQSHIRAEGDERKGM